MSSHKSLKVTYWTRVRDLFKGILLYGTVNWRRASDGLQPPRLSPDERKIATPTPKSDVIRPRHNPQAALVKATPKKQPPIRDVTAGAIVSDPHFNMEEFMAAARRLPLPPPEVEAADPPESVEGETVVVRRRRRHSRHGLQARRAPRTPVHFSDSRPGFFARLFGAR